MLRATLGSRRNTDAYRQKPTTHVGYLGKQVISWLSLLSRLACEHPLRTVAFFTIIASTSYISLLETDLFEPPATTSNAAGQLGFEAFTAGSKTLSLGPETQWRWQNGDGEADPSSTQDHDELTLLTLVFPDSIWDGIAVDPPSSSQIPGVSNSSAKVLPSSKNILSPISQEKTIAVSLPLSAAPSFLQSIRELPSSRSDKIVDAYGKQVEQKRWMMSAVKGDAAGQQRTFSKRVSDAWTAFVDLLKNAEELDIVIMALGYISMWLTFVSLYISLRRLGSHVWLATTVLFSSSFALLFGLLVTMYFGVPLNVVLLSEGLPFLVVTIGFEKPIILTKAVLSASLALKRPSSRSGKRDSGSPTSSSPNIQQAIQIAVQEVGYEITRDYAIELFVLILGAASRVQGGLCQFCFLAAWILVFDYILLFTFYTAILTIKLEINRIKRHVAVRRALEEDGVSRKVAEEVASNEDWPKLDSAGSEDLDKSRSIFGIKARDSSIRSFKFLMVAGFLGINLINFCTIPFRSGARSTSSTLSSAVTGPPMDPFKVAGSGLDALLSMAKKSKRPMDVTVLSPIKFELEYPTVHYAVPDPETGWILDMAFASQIVKTVTGGKVVEGVLKSFEDPFLSKWILAALGMSLVLNGYLFNAARWSIKEPSGLGADIAFPKEAARSFNGSPVRPRAPSRPAADQNKDNQSAIDDDDESDGALEMRKSKRTTSKKRSRSECEALLKEKKASSLQDEELVDLSMRGKIPGYALEKTLGDMTRAVKIRRSVISRNPQTNDVTSILEKSQLPFQNYHYDLVNGACCENVIGYMPLPVGVAGPLSIDGKSYFLPMATTEGVLVASTSRGCKAINAGGGAVTVLTADGMTRGPCIGFKTLVRAGQAKIWLDSEEGQRKMKEAFNSTSRFARLQSLKTALAGTYVYVRFKTTTGDAMGMNMISKGTEVALNYMTTEAGFEDMSIISVSGNFCTDKKPAAINWIDGRGKSVVAEAIIPGEVVRSVLKSDVNALVELNTAKNLIGSAMAGSIGGFNAHAANIVAAMFLATGQDPAQVVESSQCITVMKNLDGNLQISVSMPCIEVGTIGGGTFLPPQASMLDLLGVRGAHQTSPGDNSRQLARIIAAGVLAGELSLCSALAAGHLVKAHMQHNRSQVPTRAGTPTPSGAATPSVLSMSSLAPALAPATSR